MVFRSNISEYVKLKAVGLLVSFKHYQYTVNCCEWGHLYLVKLMSILYSDKHCISNYVGLIAKQGSGLLMKPLA